MDEVMQLLRERFREVGIVINYPVRSLRLPDGVVPQIWLEQRNESDIAVTAPDDTVGSTLPFKTPSPEVGSEDFPDIDGR